MDALQAFLQADLNIEKDFPIKRLGSVLRIKAVDSATLDRSREQATYGSSKERKFDDAKFKSVLITRMVVNVDFGHADMLKKYGASDSVDCVRKALLPGEIQRVVDAGLSLSGFDDEDEAVEELKN